MGTFARAPLAVLARISAPDSRFAVQAMLSRGQAPFAGAPVTIPALYIAGDRDMVVAFPGMNQLLANLKRFVPGLRNVVILAGCCHWTQQERPAEVNAALIDFLRSLPG